MSKTALQAPKILAFSGSVRKESFNQKLVENAVRDAEGAGAEVRLINLGDYPMPLMNQDLEREQGQPANATHLKELFVESHGLLIACPEYNSSITPLLKNTIDWVSRRAGDEPSLVAYKGKTAALLSASPGRLGGLRGLVHVRAILSNLGVVVLPQQHSISSAADAFDDQRQLVNDHDINGVRAVATQLVDVASRLG